MILHRYTIVRHKMRPTLLHVCATFADCRPEDVRVQTVVIAELELGNIERKVLFADLVEGPDHAALDERPEAFQVALQPVQTKGRLIESVNVPRRVEQRQRHAPVNVTCAEKAPQRHGRA